MGTCWSSSTGVVSGGCCGGTQCAPWLPSGGTWDGSSAWYCLFLPKLPLGTACNYDNKIGLCESGTFCNNICSATCVTSAPTSAAPTTGAATTGAATTGAATTVAATTVAATTVAATTAAPTTTTNNCALEAQAPCAHADYPDMVFGCCKTPYTCTLVTDKVSQCTGTNLP